MEYQMTQADYIALWSSMIIAYSIVALIGLWVYKTSNFGKDKNGFAKAAKELGLIVQRIKKKGLEYELPHPALLGFCKRFTKAGDPILNHLAIGRTNGMPTYFFTVTILSSRNYSFTCLQYELPRGIPGWFFLIPASTKLSAKRAIDHNLESIEFNNKTKLYGSDARMIYLLLPPDLMEWYLRQAEIPMVFLAGNFLTIIREKENFSSILSMTNLANHLVNYFQRNGALEPGKKEAL